MLQHSKKIREIYEDIQRKIFYMIPEKWEELYLYSSVREQLGQFETGELFFYYIPKGIIKRKPINVYEIPSKFNLDEENYLKLVEILYDSIRKLRQEFKKNGCTQLWSNVTMIIKDSKFRIVYNFDNLQNSNFDNYERHVIWRYKYLGLGMEYCNREEKKILKDYLENQRKYLQENSLKNEVYETGIYIKNVKNIVDYKSSDYESIQNVEYVASKEEKTVKNQILDKK